MMNEDLSSILEKLNINSDSISPESIQHMVEMFNNSNNTSNESRNKLFF